MLSVDPKDLLEFHIVIEDLHPDNILKEEWRGFLTPLKRELRTYPPELPGQKYKRTFNLKRNWQYVVRSPKEAEIGNAAVYAGWVQGIEQSEYHIDRWPRMVDVGEKHLKAFIEKLAKKVTRIWTR